MVVVGIAVWPRYPVASVAADEVEAQRVGHPLRAQLAAAIDAGAVADDVEVDLSRAFFANDYPYVMLAELQRAGIEFHFVPDSRNLDRFGESRCAEAGRYERLLLISGPNPRAGARIDRRRRGRRDHRRRARRVRRACRSASATCCATARIEVDGAALDDMHGDVDGRAAHGAGDAGPAGRRARSAPRRLAASGVRGDPGGTNARPSTAGSSWSNDRPPTTRRSSSNNRVRPTSAAADIVGDRDVARQQAISPPRVTPGTVTTTHTRRAPSSSGDSVVDVRIHPAKERLVIDDIRAARDAALDKIAAAAALDDIVRLDQDALGKRGTLTVLKSSLGALSGADERKAAGRALNEATSAVAAALDERRRTLAAAERSTLASPPSDSTSPSSSRHRDAATAIR